MSTFLHNKTISKTTPLRKENLFPQFNVASHKCPGIRLSFEYTTTLLSGEGGEGRTGTATMFRKMLSKYTIFSTVLSKIAAKGTSSLVNNTYQPGILTSFLTAWKQGRTFMFHAQNKITYLGQHVKHFFLPHAH